MCLGSISAGRVFFFWIFVGLFSLLSCKERAPIKKDRIIFKDPTLMVADSIRAMRGFLNRLPEAEMNNYIIPRDGRLIINNEPLGDLEVIRANRRLSSLPVFRNFSEQEARRFINLAIYLRSNFIAASHREPIVGDFLFSYRDSIRYDYFDVRSIMVINDRTDTLKVGFEYLLQILDRKDGLVLTMPKDVWSK